MAAPNRRMRRLASQLEPSAPPADDSQALSVAPAAAAPELGSSLDDVHPVDYAYSFVTGGGLNNSIRFWVESRTTLYDDINGTAITFWQVWQRPPAHTPPQQPTQGGNGGA